MSKIYQPEIIELSEKIVKALVDDDFFNEYEIESTDYALTYLKDKITEKYILGETELDVLSTTDEEFEQMLKEIIAGSVLTSLKEKGLVESYEDENTEEIFFLTEKGKEHVKKINK